MIVCQRKDVSYLSFCITPRFCKSACIEWMLGRNVVVHTGCFVITRKNRFPCAVRRLSSITSYKCKRKIRQNNVFRCNIHIKFYALKNAQINSGSVNTSKNIHECFKLKSFYCFRLMATGLTLLQLRLLGLENIVWHHK